MSIADHPSPVQRLVPRTERLWEAYRAAAAQAQRSMDYRDALAAGRAWGAFIREFEPPQNREDAR